MKRPSFQFYPADWRKDPALSICSLAARGLWIELMCVAHESDNYGVLSINGRPMNEQQIARTVGESPQIIAKLLDELESAGVFSRDDAGCIFSRRMVKDEKIRNVRAESGRLGGNPNLVKQKTSKGSTSLNQSDNQNPTPSSSSSVNPLTSSLRSEVSPPVERKKTFKYWIAEIRAAGEKAISDYKPVWEYAEKVKLPRDWVEIAWLKFRDRYTTDPNNAKKRYIDWRRVFLNAVEGNWFHLWYAKDGEFFLTTEGQQADLATRESA